MAPPKTVLDKIVHAVTKMADPTGSSRVAIVKFLKREFDLDNANDVNGDPRLLRRSAGVPSLGRERDELATGCLAAVAGAREVCQASLG